MNTSGRLLCIGEVLVEMMAEQVGQSATQPGTWRGPFPSGAPAILADQAAQCGARVTMVGAVGADAFGRACLTRLITTGVDVSRVVIDRERSTGVAFVRYREDGSRSFIFHVADAAAGQLGDSTAEELLDDVTCLHLMGSSAFSDHAVKTMLGLFHAAVERGIAVSFDPNVRIEMLTNEEHAQALTEILHGATYVLASLGELPALLGTGSDEYWAHELLESGAKVVVLKRGSAGSSLFVASKDELVMPAISVEEVDPTGAGDCFGGTFLAVVLNGGSPEDAIRYANAAGALSVTERGPMAGNRSLESIRQHLTSLSLDGPLVGQAL